VFKWETESSYRYSSETIEKHYGKATFEKKKEFVEKVKINFLGKG